MAMTVVWTTMVTLSLIFGLLTGRLDAVAAAAVDGASAAIELGVTMAGMLCLWSGVMEIMRVCGLSDRLARAFRPILRRLLPHASRDSDTLAAVSAN
ncbi:MAG: spore maturation protein A, partial [Oscillibacter sp.]